MKISSVSSKINNYMMECGENSKSTNKTFEVEGVLESNSILKSVSVARWAYQLEI